MKKYSVHIVPGWSEGHWQVSQFRGAFPENFEWTPNADKADIIIAHSSGCYSLPKGNNPMITLLIDPPYWPGKPLILCILRNCIFDVPKQIASWGFGFWLKMRLHNTVTAVKYPFGHIKIWRSLRRALLISLESQKAILVRDNQDAYCGPEVKQYVAKYKNVDYIELDGLHEDCWRHPEKYIELIQKEL